MSVNLHMLRSGSKRWSLRAMAASIKRILPPAMDTCRPRRAFSPAAGASVRPRTYSAEG